MRIQFEYRTKVTIVKKLPRLLDSDLVHRSSLSALLSLSTFATGSSREAVLCYTDDEC